MQKPVTLRQAIVSELPEFGRDPERLLMWVEKGSVETRLGGDFSFSQSYKLNIILTDFTGAPEAIIIAILAWQSVNQPDLHTAKNQAFSFSVDILDNKTVDLMFELEIEESVKVTAREGGGFELEFIPEPNPAFDDDIGLGGANPVPPIREIWLTTGEKLQPDVQPLGADVQPAGAFPL